mmetsp:Transcript_17392/g.25532  ORF Transcript_17392/g.25532 Transcript_17392/m.25532 type:complete len:259 (-) Transcript_17392:426-1202(-)
MLFTNHFFRCLLKLVIVLGTKGTLSWAVCAGWCQDNTYDWNNKCTWKRCNGCQSCQPKSVYPSGQCNDWCSGNTYPWISKCTWFGCSACWKCNPSPVCDDNICENWCGPNTFDLVNKCAWKKCCGCSECDSMTPPTMAPFGSVNPMPAYSVCVPGASVTDQPTPHQCTFSPRCSDDSDCGSESCSEMKCGFVELPPPIYNCYFNIETSDGNNYTGSAICGDGCTFNSDCSNRILVHNGGIFNYTGCDINMEHGCSPSV